MVMVQIGGIQKFSTVDYPGHTCAAVFLIGCNMRCGYCHNPELVLPEQYIGCIPEAEILDFLARRVGLLDGVAISGGEPTMSEDLPDFIRAIKQLGFLVKLDTNGTHPAMLRQMLDEQLLDFVAMDIKGPLEKYVEIAARPIDTDAIMESIDLIRSQVDHEFRTTIVRGQLEPVDFDAVGQMVQGAQRFALQHFIASDTLVSSRFCDETSFTDEEMAQAQHIMQRYVTECVVH